jgi:PAS domain S-box-containing protein
LRSRIEDSERRLHAIFDQSFQYVGVLTPDGTVLDINQVAVKGTGSTKETLVGSPLWDAPCWAHCEEQQDKLREAIRLAAAGDFVRFEAEHRDAEGESRTFDLSLKPVRDDEGQIVLLIPEGRDITEIKRAQHSENAMLRGLAEIGESASVLVHEIKNPITGIKAALKAVAESLGEDDQEVLSDLLGRLQKLERIMRRTLSFTKPVYLQYTTIDVVPWLQSVLATLGPVIDKSEVTVQFVPPDAPLELKGDSGLLEEVVSNLVSNAIEAVETSEERHRVVLRTSDGDGHTIVITVEDDGPGIPERLREDLFKPFYTTKTKGSGLGLAFCRKVIEEHGGTIQVEESALGGAVFTLRIPLRPKH